MLALNSSLNKKIVDMVPQNFKIDQAYKPSPLQQSPGLLSSNSKIPLFKSSMATITKDNNIDQSTRILNSKIPIYRRRAAISKDNVLSMKLSVPPFQLNKKFHSNKILSVLTAPQENEMDNGKFQRKVLYQLSNMANEIKVLRIAVETMTIPSLEPVAQVHLEVIGGAIGTLDGYSNLEEQCGVLANRIILVSV
ncbi:uncharacterized protein LOC136079602 [Hydra vulgaris]|uniref:Uncharacterized protein LOC136079602 n=1 Tax=Hydra vulgaris TaxID=6087 RepID=A0ABM4BRB7_HYDVU